MCNMYSMGLQHTSIELYALSAYLEIVRSHVSSSAIQCAGTSDNICETATGAEPFFFGGGSVSHGLLNLVC